MISPGLFPSSFIDSFSIARGYTKNGVIRNLKERGFLDTKDPERPMVGGKREYCFAMTDTLKTRLADVQLPAIAQTDHHARAAESIMEPMLF